MITYGTYRSSSPVCVRRAVNGYLANVVRWEVGAGLMAMSAISAYGIAARCGSDDYVIRHL